MYITSAVCCIISYSSLWIIITYLFVNKLYNLLLTQRQSLYDNNIKINDKQNKLIKLSVKYISIIFTVILIAFIIAIINAIIMKYYSNLKYEMLLAFLLFSMLIGIWFNFCLSNFGDNLYQILFKSCDKLFMSFMVLLVVKTIKKRLQGNNQSISNENVKNVELNQWLCIYINKQL